MKIVQLKYLIILFSIAAQNTFAEGEPSVRFTPKLGLNITSATAKNKSTGEKFSITPGAGFSAGGEFEFPMPDKRFVVFADLIFSLSSVSEEVSSINIDEGFKQLRLPVQVGFYLAPSLRVGAGLFTAYGIGSISLSSGSTSVDISYADAEFQKSAYGSTLSVALVMPMESRALTLEGRWNYTFSDVNRNSDIVTHMSTFDLLMGIKF